MRRWKRWAGSRRGVCSIALAVTALVYAVSQGKVQLLQVPLAAPVVLGVAAAVVFVLAAMWEDKLHPATPRFVRAQPPTSTRQFREDANARVFTNHTGFLFAQRGFFVGTGCPPVLLPLAFLAQARAAQQAAPVLVASTPTRRFWYGDRRGDADTDGETEGPAPAAASSGSSGGGGGESAPPIPVTTTAPTSAPAATRRLLIRAQSRCPRASAIVATTMPTSPTKIRKLSMPTALSPEDHVGVTVRARAVGWGAL